MTTFLIIYVLGYFYAYFLLRKLVRESEGENYHFGHVVAILFMSFYSFIAIGCFGIYGIYEYLNINPIKPPKVKFPKPPKFL